METQPCNLCGRDLPLSAFSPRQKKCRACRAANAKQRRQSDHARIRAAERQREANGRKADPLRFILKDAKQRARKAGLAFDLDRAFLEALYRQSGGRCAVSGLPFDVDAFAGEFSRAPFRPSLDRIDSRKGYVRENVRLVLCAVNAALNEYGLPLYLKIAAAAVARNAVSAKHPDAA